MKRFKLVVPSFIAIIFCMLLIAGSTFALFTSQDSADISVTSGKVEMTAELSAPTLYSAKAVETVQSSDDFAGEITTGNYAGKYIFEQQTGENPTFANGGTAALNQDGELELINITPGDKVKLNLTLTNNSNVDIQYRLFINGSEDEGILEALTFTIKEGTNDAQSFNGIILVGKWQEWEAPANAQDKVKVFNLELVLPLDKVNEYQRKTANIHFTIEAVQANAKVDKLLEQVNDHLAESTKKNKTMYEAKGEAEAFKPEFDATKYLWNMDTDQFYAPSTIVGGNPSRFFKAYTYDEYQIGHTYSVYAVAGGTESWPTSLEINHNFDQGDVSMNSITYNTSSASTGQEVVINTNGVTLTINAPLDIVHHYGNVTKLDIIEVAGESYHEHGAVSLAKIKTGRIVLTPEAEVSKVHVVETNGSYEGIKVAVVGAATLPEFSRDDVELNSGDKKLVIELQSIQEEGQVDENPEYIWISKEGDSTTAQVATSGTALTEGTIIPQVEQTTSAISIAQTAGEGLSATEVEEMETNATRYASGDGSQEKPYMITNGDHIQSFYADIAAGSTTGKYYKLGADIAVSNVPAESAQSYKVSSGRWDLTPSKWFKGNFNGNNHTIYFDYHGSSTTTVSLFGNMDQAQLYDLKVVCNIVNNSDTQWVAAICIQTKNGTTFNNVDVSGSITNRNDISGFCINSQDASYTNCDSTVNLHNIDGRNGHAQYVHVAGFEAQCGKNTTFTNCSYNGTITIEKDQYECDGPFASGFIATNDNCQGIVLTNCTSNVTIISDYDNQYVTTDSKQYIYYKEGCNELLKFFAYHKYYTISINGVAFATADHSFTE